ncbi:MAG TPA: plastocyanin/azurin family copper-binding protein, partial [Candidatus Thermoplasmatota archaeon]|nr:plastocyanin/azurin family copper-binding protein [Candidatus Thermoplasmatota archaeon]
MSRRRAVLLLAGLLGVVALAGAAQGADVARTLRAVADDNCTNPRGNQGFCFDQERITIAPGDNLTITFENPDDQPHNWCVRIGGTAHCAPGPELHRTINTGQTATVTINNIPAGQYRYFCNPHDGAGMEGQLVVQADGGGNGPPPPRDRT